jgi:hypothetical protein
MASTAEADRGRPSIQNRRTLVADSGHALLRGARWSVDLNGSLPPRHWITDLKNYGFNALHLYAEANGGGYSPGARAAAVDTLVNWTGEDGLYLVITIGNGFPGFPGYDATFAQGFWSFYAPRYKDRTHVVYEIYNEPYISGIASAPSPIGVRNLQKDMYNLIRGLAPSTPILFFSYALLRTQAGILEDLAWLDGQLGTSIWSNAAVAFHGYSGVTPTSSILGTILSRGYPCIATEFYVPPTESQDVAETEAFESRGVSWLSFLTPDLVFDDSKYKTPLEQGGVVWVADYGTWPATSLPPAPGTQIALKALANGKWVATGANLLVDPLIANKDFVSGPSEKYVLTAVSGGYYIALRSQSALKFADADATSSYVIPNRDFAANAKLEWMTLPNGDIVLKAFRNNKFISADLALNNPPKLIANHSKVTSSERFIFSVVP